MKVLLPGTMDLAGCFFSHHRMGLSSGWEIGSKDLFLRRNIFPKYMCVYVRVCVSVSVCID